MRQVMNSDALIFPDSAKASPQKMPWERRRPACSGCAKLQASRRGDQSQAFHCFRASHEAVWKTPQKMYSKAVRLLVVAHYQQDWPPQLYIAVRFHCLWASPLTTWKTPRKSLTNFSLSRAHSGSLATNWRRVRPHTHIRMLKKLSQQTAICVNVKKVGSI